MRMRKFIYKVAGEPVANLHDVAVGDGDYITVSDLQVAMARQNESLAGGSLQLWKVLIPRSKHKEAIGLSFNPSQVMNGSRTLNSYFPNQTSLKDHISIIVKHTPKVTVELEEQLQHDDEDDDAGSEETPNELPRGPSTRSSGPVPTPNTPMAGPSRTRRGTWKAQESQGRRDRSSKAKFWTNDLTPEDKILKMHIDAIVCDWVGWGLDDFLGANKACLGCEQGDRECESYAKEPSCRTCRQRKRKCERPSKFVAERLSHILRRPVEEMVEAYRRLSPSYRYITEDMTCISKGGRYSRVDGVSRSSKDNDRANGEEDASRGEDGEAEENGGMDDQESSGGGPELSTSSFSEEEIHKLKAAAVLTESKHEAERRRLMKDKKALEEDIALLKEKRVGEGMIWNVEREQLASAAAAAQDALKAEREQMEVEREQMVAEMARQRHPGGMQEKCNELEAKYSALERERDRSTANWKKLADGCQYVIDDVKAGLEEGKVKESLEALQDLERVVKYHKGAQSGSMSISVRFAPEYEEIERAPKRARRE